MALCNMYFTVTLNTWNENETSERHNELVTASKTQKASSDMTLEEGSLFHQPVTFRLLVQAISLTNNNFLPFNR